MGFCPSTVAEYEETPCPRSAMKSVATTAQNAVELRIAGCMGFTTVASFTYEFLNDGLLNARAGVGQTLEPEGQQDVSGIPENTDRTNTNP